MGNKYDNSLTLLSKPTITQASVPIFYICDSFFLSPWQKLPIIVWTILNVLASFKKVWLTGATNGRSSLFSVTSIHVKKGSVFKWTCNMILVKFASKYFSWHLCFCQYFLLEIALPHSDASFSKFEISAKMRQCWKHCFSVLKTGMYPRRYFPVLNFALMGLLIDLVWVYLLWPVIS